MNTFSKLLAGFAEYRLINRQTIFVALSLFVSFLPTFANAKIVIIENEEKVQSPSPVCDEVLKTKTRKVLVVDAEPQKNLQLYYALNEFNFEIKVATTFLDAIELARSGWAEGIFVNSAEATQSDFDLIQRFKTDEKTKDIPIIFGADDDGEKDGVRALQSGASDFISRPVRIPEFIARMEVRIRQVYREQVSFETLDKLDAATIALNADLSLAWYTKKAADLFGSYFTVEENLLTLRNWAKDQIRNFENELPLKNLQSKIGNKVVVLTLYKSEIDRLWLIRIREQTDVIERLMNTFALSPKQAEVLYWVYKGKTDRDIATILGSARLTVKKHMELIRRKLKVETREAAAALAHQKVPELSSQ